MKKIDRNSKVLNITHNDLDGCGCSILLKYVFNNIDIIPCSYNSIDKELMSIQPEEYDYIFVTDIFPRISETLSRFDNLILIDHHQTATNNHENRWYVNTKYSATFLVKHFLDKMYGQKLLSNHTNLVKLINDYDMWELKYKGSKVLNTLYSLYYANKFLDRFLSGNIELTQSEKTYIIEDRKSFESLYENLEVIEFETINACLFFSDVKVNDLSDKLLFTDNYDIVFFNTLKSYKISIRSKIKDFNVGMYLKEKNIGGGHYSAAGIDLDTEEDMNNMIDFLEQDLYNLLPSIRK